MNVLAVDLGGMSAKVALFQEGTVKKEWVVNTDINNIFQNIKDNLNGLNENDYDVVGFAMPGFIDHKKGIVKLSGNLKLNDFNAKAEAEKVFKKSAYIVNDANAAALGEFWKGAGAKYDTIALYTIGTGVGGGLVFNGDLVYGKDGYAGEFGHGGNFQDKWECTCGLKHCIEPVSSATGMERALEEHFGKKIKLKDVSKEIVNGDPEVTAIIKEALMPLAAHISTLETAINPDAIIIGGGPTAMGEPFRKIIEDNVKELQLDFIHEATDIVLATTKNDAGKYGAAYWAIYNKEK